MALPILAGPRRRLLKVVDQVLDAMQDVPDSLGWADSFSGGLRPTEPTTAGVELTIKAGRLPANLSGVFLRVGPNVQKWPPAKRTHAFDGDGMVHALRIANGTAIYNCNYMETPRQQIERELGTEWFTRIGELHGKPGAVKALAVMRSKRKLYGLQEWETSNANTAICITPEGKLWAMNELGPPFRFRLCERGSISSEGFDTFVGTHAKPMCVHPKIDRSTSETFFFGKHLGKFYVGRAKGGEVVDRCDCRMLNGFNHDMFITQSYVCVIDGSLRFEPKGAVAGKPLWMFRTNSKLRFGIFPRSIAKMTEESCIWVEAPVAADIIHVLHAYEEDGKIILWAPVNFFEKGGNSAIIGNMALAKMHKLAIDIEKRSVKMQLVPGGEDSYTEFSRVREDRVGLDCRYGFSALQEYGGDFNFRGILKWDFVEARLCGTVRLPENVVGGEAVFLPRQDSAPDATGDDGYIGLFLWDCESLESSFAIYDARSFSSTPVAELSVPRRVPLGFHADWITEEQFQQQLSTP